MPSGCTSAADFGPYGRERDEAVEQALADAGVELVRTGSPYAVDPGRVRNGSGEPYKVFTPFSRAWNDVRLGRARRRPDRRLVAAAGRGHHRGPRAAGPCRPRAARGRGGARPGGSWEEFLDRVDDYDTDRDRPDRDGTSRMSVHLKYGEVHPRTLLADLGAKREQGRPDLPHRAGLARVLRRRAPPAPRLGPRLLQARVRPDGLRRAPATSWPPGRRAAPASRSSTPACASCAPPAGCTTGCG